tara:strand:- start:315 stop:1049 length:735 start_codon:yes stop_codon:yes gene_type:complete
MINVYWSSANDPKEDDFSIMYEEPHSLFKDKVKEKQKDRQTDMPGFDECTAFQDLGIHTLVVNNVIQTHIEFDGNYIPNYQTPVKQLSKNALYADVRRDNTLNNQMIFDYHMPHIFFADASLEVMLSSPYFHQPGYMKYGAIVPGRFDVGSWFRPMRFEINLWEGNNIFKIEEGEPLAYLTFNTNEKIKLHKFHMNEKLYNIALACANSSAWWRNIPLSKRYAKFHASQSQKKVLTEIKNNLIV